MLKHGSRDGMWSKHANWSDFIEGMLSVCAERILISSPENYYEFKRPFNRSTLTSQLHDGLDMYRYMLYECKHSLNA